MQLCVGQRIINKVMKTIIHTLGFYFHKLNYFIIIIIIVTITS